MADLSNLAPGLTGTVSVVVNAERLATAVGSGNAPVFASPMLITAFEAAAVRCVEHLLPEGHLSLGMHLDCAHTAPTPAGLTVTATATLTAVDGRKLTFAVTAQDGIETIGKGTHVRAVVDRPRFLARIAAKTPPPA